MQNTIQFPFHCTLWFCLWKMLQLFCLDAFMESAQLCVRFEQCNAEWEAWHWCTHIEAVTPRGILSSSHVTLLRTSPFHHLAAVGWRELTCASSCIPQRHSLGNFVVNVINHRFHENDHRSLTDFNNLGVSVPTYLLHLNICHCECAILHLLYRSSCNLYVDSNTSWFLNGHTYQFFLFLVHGSKFECKGENNAIVYCSQSLPSKKDSDLLLIAFCLRCPVIHLSLFSHTSHLAITFILFLWGYLD